MKNILTHRFYLLTLCFVMATLMSFSQNPHIEWSAQSDLINANGVNVTLASSISKQNTTITWQQVSNNATQTSTFTILSVSGIWDSQSSTGEINYSISSDGTEGNFKLLGNAEGITATLSFYESGVVTDTYIFQLNSITQL